MRNRGFKQTPEASKKTQKSSKLTQQHLISPKRQNSGHTLMCAENPRIYVDVPRKTVCTRDCEDKTRIQEEKEIKKKVNRQVETKFTPIRHY